MKTKFIDLRKKIQKGEIENIQMELEILKLLSMANVQDKKDYEVVLSEITQKINQEAQRIIYLIKQIGVFEMKYDTLSEDLT